MSDSLIAKCFDYQDKILDLHCQLKNAQESAAEVMFNLMIEYLKLDKDKIREDKIWSKWEVRMERLKK